ncbi:hypothetical protein [Streptomyces sp. HC307]|uniref:hypothetical protein n=1 Tax=Streptomyces flavusporus TaxID=3385496 RepID=UPI003917277D
MAIKRCKSPFSVWKNGVPRVITGGQLVEDTDPVYKGHEHLFEDVETFVSDRAAQVEQATADPGEPRDLTPPAAADSKSGDGEKQPPRRGRRTTK